MLFASWVEVPVRRALAAATLLCLLAGGPAHSEDKALHGIALVIGQSDYESLGRLANPANDARAINGLLTGLGFEVDLVANADRKKLAKALDRFVEDAAEADVALIYYSGHGIEAGGENFLLPVDADVSALDRAGETLVPVSSVLARLQASVPVTIVLLDACRSNPFPAGVTVRLEANATPVEIEATGLGTPRGAVALGGEGNGDKGLGAVIGFAAAPGRVALDGEPNGNSPYAAALLKHFSAPGFAFADVMTMVTEEVYLATGARQTPWTNASLRRLLYFGGPAETGGDADQSAIRGERRKLLLTISTFGEVERQQVAATANNDGVPMDALFAMLKAIGADTPTDPDQLATLLKDQAQRLKALLEDRAAIANPDPEIARLTVLANEAVGQGALDAAIALRERAKSRVAALTSTVADADAELRAKHVEFAAVFADSAETYALAFDNVRAAEDFGKAFDEVSRWDDRLALVYKVKQAQALSDLGYYRADEDVSRRAIAAYEDASRLVSPARDPQGWTDTQIGLAMTLWKAGQRASDDGELGRAASVLMDAIASPALAAHPKQVAHLKAGLALVLVTIGNRRTGTEELAQAERHAREALELETRDAAPDQWARLQDHLGSALYLHGLRDRSSERFEGAEAAFRSALEIWTRDSNPLSWANTHNNLGVVVGQLGLLDPDTRRLQEAIGHFEAALEVRTRELIPMFWAESMVNLAGVYVDLGKRWGDARLFDLGAETFRTAAEEITRQRDPLRWAALQVNIGIALSGKATATNDPAPLEGALAAFEEALKERTRAKVPLDWAATMNVIGNAYQRLGTLTNNPEAYRAAARAFAQALGELTPERAVTDWARAQNNLANALSTLGEIEKDVDSLSQAVVHYRLALQAYPVDENPSAHAETQFNLAVALLAIARGTGSQEALDATREAAQASYEVYSAAGQTQYEPYFVQIQAGIDAVQAAIDKQKAKKRKK